PASCTCGASRSSSEYTATLWTPSSASARSTRTAISPRLATSTFANISPASLVDQSRADRLVAALVDHDEAARAAVLGVRVERQRHARAQVHPADVVELKLLRRRGALERVHVHAVLDAIHDRRGAARGVLDRVVPARPQRVLGHPAHVRLELAPHARR